MPWCVPGHMILNTETGDRMCIENPAYKEVKELRGNNPNLHYHYLCLLRIEKIQDFLNYFPQYKRIFSKFYNQFESFITNTHHYYVDYFIKHKEIRVPKNYFMLIHRLHKEIYIPSLRQPGDKIIMKRPIIREGFLKLTPQEMFYYIYPK
jgi:tRNA A37 threonylcarbamoyladenosine synthetase subunit TsaC/SUA5/YrdC